jgi:kynurenine formamidase
LEASRIFNQRETDESYQPDADSRAISYTRVVDLSHDLHPGIPRWPGDPPVEFLETAKIDREGYRLRRFSLGEHSGTHMNAPSSFHPTGVGIDAYPGESLVRPASVVDLPGGVDADYALTRDDVLAWEGSWGPVAPGSLALLRTNWSMYWDTPDAYLGLDERGTPHYPGFGLSAVRFLLTQRSVSGIGIDAPGVDPGTDTAFTINRAVLEQPRIVLENLTNLDRLPPTGATLVIGRLRLRAGSGSPVSVLALVP